MKVLRSRTQFAADRARGHGDTGSPRGFSVTARRNSRRRRAQGPQANRCRRVDVILGMSLQGAIVPSTMLAVALSNDMCRQNLPSGIVTTMSPSARASRAPSPSAGTDRSRHDRRPAERRRQQHDKDGGSDDGAGGRRAVITLPSLRAFFRSRFRGRAVDIRGPRRRLQSLLVSPQRISPLNNRIIESPVRKCF